jgi:hypothetical protein
VKKSHARIAGTRPHLPSRAGNWKAARRWTVTDAVTGASPPVVESMFPNYR